MLNEIYRLEYMLRQLRKEGDSFDKNLELLSEQIKAIANTTEEFISTMGSRLEPQHKQYFDKKYSVYLNNAKRVVYNLSERSTKRRDFIDSYAFLFSEGQHIGHDDFTKLVDIKENGYIAMFHLQTSHKEAKGAILKKIGNYLRSEHGACLVEHPATKVEKYIYTDKPQQVFAFLNTMRDSEFVFEGKNVKTNVRYDAVRLPYKDGFELDNILDDLSGNLAKVIKGETIPGSLQGLPLSIEGAIEVQEDETKDKTSGKVQTYLSEIKGKYILLVREAVLVQVMEKIAAKVPKDVSLYPITDMENYRYLQNMVKQGADLHGVKAIIIQHPPWEETQTLDILEFIRIASGFQGAIVITSEKSNATMHRVLSKYSATFLTVDQIAKRGVHFFLEDLK